MTMFRSKNSNGKIDVVWSDVDSSMINYMHYHYDGHKGVLGVTFNSGDSYIYDNVQLQIVINLLKSESVGSAFSKTIRTSFPYTNIGKMEGKSPLTKLGIEL